MKRILSLLCLVILSSCMINKELKTDFKSINFDSSYIVTIPTKTIGDLTTISVRSNGNTMGVFGYSYELTDITNTSNWETLFNNTEVTYNETSDAWNYSPLRYWDSAKKYTFASYIPKTEIDANSIPTYDLQHGFSISKIPITQVIEDDGIDYLVSKAVNCISDGKVCFTMKHILSRFSVYVWTDIDESAKVTLNDLQIYLPKGTANYSQANAASPVSTIVKANGDPDVVNDTWEWKAFVNNSNSPDANYQTYQMVTTPIEVKHFTIGPVPTTNDASELTEMHFFIAPTQTDKHATVEDLQLYMTLTWKIEYIDNGETITQNFVRDVPIKIQDLHSFTQNYRTNLFVKLISKNDAIEFYVTKVEDYENTVNHYVDENGHSFDVISYNQMRTPTIDGIEGVLFNYGNIVEGNTDKELTYKLSELIPIGETDNVLTSEHNLIFADGWGNEEIPYGNDHTVDYPYGKFIIDLTEEVIVDGDYWMIIKNSMNDVRKYKIRLISGPSMSFTINVDDLYTIPFLTYETASKYFDTEITKKIPGFLSSVGISSIAVTPLIKDFNTWCEYVANSAFGISDVDTKDLCFRYPSTIKIDWGDFSDLDIITAGTYVLDSNLPKHEYETAGKYTITIYSNQTDYTKSQIPQLSWSSHHISTSNILSTNGDGIIDNELISIDSPILHMENNWIIHEITFGADPIASGHDLYMYAFACDFLGLHLSPHDYWGSQLSGMFNTCSKLKKLCDSPFKYNGNHWSLDFTFQFCHSLELIPNTLFDGCDILESLYYTFDNAALKALPTDLFKYTDRDIWFKCTFLDCTSLNDDNVSDNMFENVGLRSIFDGTFTGTGVTKY